MSDEFVMPPVHPGEALAEEYLKPLGVTQHRLAVAIGVSPRRINEIVHGSAGSRLIRRCGSRVFSARRSGSGSISRCVTTWSGRRTSMPTSSLAFSHCQHDIALSLVMRRKIAA